MAAWGIVWIAIDGRQASGSCTASAAPNCVPLYNTKTVGYVLTGVGVAAAASGGVLLYTGRTHSGEVSVAAGPSSLFLTGRF